MGFDLYDFIESDPTEAGSENTINFWITQSIVDNSYTGSFIQALTVPRISSNGNLDTTLREATEFVVQLPSGSTSVFRRADIETRKQFENYFYLKLEQNILIPSGSLTFNISSDDFKVGFVPNNETKFKFSDYDIQGFNITSTRQSTRHLTVDRSTSSPGTGIYSGFLVPQNYEALSASFYDNISDTIPDRLFSDLQESNYSVSSWVNSRYDGSVESNLGITGSEPALSFESFEGVVFPSSSANSTIKTLVSTSLAELETFTTYFAVIGSIPSNSRGNSLNYYESGSTTGTALPYPFVNNLSNEDIYSIFLYREKEDNDNILVKISNSKILNTNNSRILKTNNLGKVESITI